MRQINKEEEDLYLLKLIQDLVTLQLIVCAINMICWNILAITALIITLQAISLQNKKAYHLSKGNNITHIVQVKQAMRYTFLQIQGHSELTIIDDDGNNIANINKSLYQNTLSKEMIGKNINFMITAKTNASGFIEITPKTTHEQLHDGTEKMIHLRKGQKRLIEIAPKQGRKLTIERFDGTPQFINNKCKSYERKECIDELHRFAPIEFKKHIEVVTLDSCSNCIIILQIRTNSNETRLRLSINANRTTFSEYPTLLLIKKGQIEHISVNNQVNATGVVSVYSGSVQISSQSAEFNKLGNGFRYKPKEEDNSSITIQIIGESPISYLMVQNPSDYTHISLIDGLPITHLIEPNVNYYLTYQNFNVQRSNIVLSGTSEFLQRLSIKFTDQLSHQHYLIRPKFFFSSSTASQSFQLPAEIGSIMIELHLVEGPSGELGAACEVNEHISLPLGQLYSNILNYNEYDDYIFEGLSGEIDIEIKKCVDCVLKYTISEQPITSMPKYLLLNNSIKQSHKLLKNVLYVRVYTTNYAYYSIIAKKHSAVNESSAILQNHQIKFYINQDSENTLLLQFYPPLCGKVSCKNVKYFFMEGSDQKHLSSKVYCPTSLFDFDQKTKDIVVEQFTPNQDGEVLIYSRPMRHRDYIGVVAEVQGVVLSYQAINTEEIKLYRSMRWPIFYLSLFITVSVFAAFMLFMVLRRKSRGENGYVRPASSQSFE